MRDLAGQQVDMWEAVYERWAEVRPLHRVDPLPAVADTRHMARRWRIVIRDGRKPDLGMRIRWREELLAIAMVEADPAKPGWITLWCEDFGPSAD